MRLERKKERAKEEGRRRTGCGEADKDLSPGTDASTSRSDVEREYGQSRVRSTE